MARGYKDCVLPTLAARRGVLRLVSRGELSLRLALGFASAGGVWGPAEDLSWCGLVLTAENPLSWRAISGACSALLLGEVIMGTGSRRCPRYVEMPCDTSPSRHRRALCCLQTPFNV